MHNLPEVLNFSSGSLPINFAEKTMKKRKILVSFFLLGILPTLFAQKVKTLKECIALGIENNLSLNNARIEMSRGKTGLSQSRALLLPTLTAAFQFTDYLKKPVNVTTGTLLGTDFPEDPTWQTIQSTQYNVATGIQLAMPLYNQTILAGIDVAKTVDNLKQLSYEKAREDLTVQISKLYYLAQNSLEQQFLLKENIARMNELCSITEALYQQGVVMEIDLTRVQINLKNLSAQEDQLQTLHEQQLNLLRFLMDLNVESPLAVTRMKARIEPEQATGLSLHLPELQVAEKQLELIRKQIKSIKAGYLPTLSLTGQLGALGYQEEFRHFFHGKESSQNWFGNSYFGIAIRLPLFEGNSRRLKIKQHRYAQLQAENKKAELLKQLEQSYANATLQLNHNVEVLQTQTENYRQAKEVYQVTEEKYKEGVASMTELLQDEMRLRTAQSACVQAQSQCLLAQLELLKLSGHLNDLSK